jgi:hypothetical protein
VTPQAFIEKWRNVELKERSASQSHFNDLCRLLDVLDPTTADPKGTWFTFEKGASKTSGGEGWADVLYILRPIPIFSPSIPQGHLTVTEHYVNIL